MQNERSFDTIRLNVSDIYDILACKAAVINDVLKVACF